MLLGMGTKSRDSIYGSSIGGKAPSFSRHAYGHALRHVAGMRDLPHTIRSCRAADLIMPRNALDARNAPCVFEINRMVRLPIGDTDLPVYLATGKVDVLRVSIRVRHDLFDSGFFCGAIGVRRERWTRDDHMTHNGDDGDEHQESLHHEFVRELGHTNQ
jgi:hypothetical protein